jgi:hypothetical protein
MKNSLVFPEIECVILTRFHPCAIADITAWTLKLLQKPGVPDGKSARAVITVAPTVEAAGAAAEVNAASAWPTVLPFTIAARIPVVPEPTRVAVVVLGVADVIRPDDRATTTVLPAVLGLAGIEPPPVLSGADPEALSGDVPTLVTDND